LYSVAVLEPVSGKVTGLLCDWLVRRACGPSVVVTRGDGLDAFSGAYDLFVVGAGPRFEAEGPVRTVTPTCRALLTPSGEDTETLGISAQWVVGYGLAARDSLTVSSLEPDQAVLALQRELPTLTGTVIEQQELPISIPPGTGAQVAMALYGSLLVLGVLPEELGA